MSHHGLLLLTRRQFLRLLLMAGGLAGCQGLAPNTPTFTLTGEPAGSLSGTRFFLEDDAVRYEPHPAGCDRATIHGTVQDAAGVGLSSVTIHIWTGSPDSASVLLTDGQGVYETDVAGGPTDQVYNLQIFDAATGSQLSDVIVAEAVPTCEHNLMTVNFIAAQP
jgi:hypothetical protein